jgi:ABC-type branched-subunit amino acid transport system ATPase component
MDRELMNMISKKLEQFHCSILLDEVKEKVRKLKTYGVDDAEIMAAMNEEDLFPQLIVTEDYKVVLAGEKPMEIEMEPLVKAVYLLFLSHPEGIVLKCLPDYQKELTELYLLLRP